MTLSPDKLGTIRKLWAKAEGTTNPHEAAAFMAKAQAMMAAEGVDMEAVDLSAIGEARVRSRFSVSRLNVAENTLMHAVAESFGCKLLWLAKRSSFKDGDFTYKITGKDSWAEHILVGSKDRLGLAVYAAEVLGRQLRKARDQFAKAQATKYWDFAYAEAETEWDRIRIKEDCAAAIRKQVTKDADSFAAGWAWEIRKRVIAFALNDKEQALLETYTKDVSGEAKEKDTELNHQFHKGVDAAKSADLHRPIDESGVRAPLLSDTKQLGHG